MSSPVSIVKCRTYDEEEVSRGIRESLRLIGGIEPLVKRGDRVLLKPNLLLGKAPEKAVTTHPSIIKGIIEIVKEAGGVPFIGDSPGIGSALRVADKAGIKTVAEALGCPILNFDQPTLSPKGKGNVFKQLEIDQTVLDADVVINLPKWKTHGQMLLTLGVKNLYGCIPGPRKALWHLKAGEDRKVFARMLFDIYQTINPSLTLLDGVVGMEGSGPSSGRPIPMGLILASKDALSLDQIVCDLLNLPRKSLLTNRVAFESGIGKDPIEVLGEKIEAVRIPRYEFPPPYRADWYLPGFLKRVLNNALSAKPVILHELCKACLQCVEVCPPKALTSKEKKLTLSDKKCIRCFCCQEICPEGAIKIEPGWASRVLGRRQKVN